MTNASNTRSAERRTSGQDDLLVRRERHFHGVFFRGRSCFLSLKVPEGNWSDGSKLLGPELSEARHPVVNRLEPIAPARRGRDAAVPLPARGPKASLFQDPKMLGLLAAAGPGAEQSATGHSPTVPAAPGQVEDLAPPWFGATALKTSAGGGCGSLQLAHPIVPRSGYVKESAIRARTIPAWRPPCGKPSLANLSLTLDGVIQAPGRPDEHARGGFTHGGWAIPLLRRGRGEGRGRGNGEEKAGAALRRRDWPR